MLKLSGKCLPYGLFFSVPAFAKHEDTNLSYINWDYDYIHRANLLLDNIDKPEMNETEKYWRSVGYFFCSHKYFQMLCH